jgi:hypothetical protein
MSTHRPTGYSFFNEQNQEKTTFFFIVLQGNADLDEIVLQVKMS